MKLLIPILAIFFFLSGCDTGPNVAELCKANTEICHEFNEDNWCKRERISVALSRIDLKNSQKDADKYKVLVAYEGYAECMSLASKIQHIKLKEKTTKRINNYVKAKEQIEKISNETLASEHPHLLYYHWTRELNESSLNKFLQLEGTSALENSTSQLHLATYYTKRDLEKTLSLLFHALELRESTEDVDPEIYHSLTTIFTKKKKYKQAYIWLKIQSLSDSNDKKIMTALTQYQKVYQLDTDFLNKVAENTLNKIDRGEFTTPKF